LLLLAGCGGEQAIKLAEEKPVDALMFFSSGMGQDTLDSYKMLDSTPTFIIAAQGDTQTFKSSQQLFKDSFHLQNRLINFKGNGHGYPLFKQDPSLVANMADWFKLQLQ